MTNKLIILDRDGVINYDSPDYIKSPDEWHPIPGSLQAIKMLNDAGIVVAIATNQAGIGRGIYTLDDMREIHAKMYQMLEDIGAKIDYIAFCPHHPDTYCYCRKPEPGMVEEICGRYQVNPLLQKVYFVGDSTKDVQAATTANCTPIIVKTGNGMDTIQRYPNEQSFNNLYEFVQSLELAVQDKYLAAEHNFSSSMRLDLQN